MSMSLIHIPKTSSFLQLQKVSGGHTKQCVQPQSISIKVTGEQGRHRREAVALPLSLSHSDYRRNELDTPDMGTVPHVYHLFDSPGCVSFYSPTMQALGWCGAEHRPHSPEPAGQTGVRWPMLPEQPSGICGAVLSTENPVNTSNV